MRQVKIVLVVVILLANITMFTPIATAQSLDDVQQVEEDEVDKEVMRDISSTVSLVDTGYEDGQTVLTFQSSTQTDIEVVYPLGGGQLERFTVSIDQGTTEVTMRDKYPQVALWDGNQGLQVPIQGQGILADILSGATAEHLEVSAVGGGTGTLFAISIWIMRKKEKSESTWDEVIWGMDSVETHQSRSMFGRLREKILSTKLLAVIGVGYVVARWQGYTMDDVPIEVWIFGLASVGVGFLSYFIIPQINQKLELWQPAEEIVAAVNFEKLGSDIPLTAWVSSPEVADDIDFEGERRTIQRGNKTVHFVREFYPSEQRAVAGDLMSLPEEHLGAYISAIEEHRARDSVAKRGFRKMSKKIDKIANRVSLSHHLNLQEKEREMSEYNADNIGSVIRETVPEYEKLMNGGEVTEEYKELKENIESTAKDAGNSDKNGGGTE